MPSNLDTENQLVKSLTDKFKTKIKTEYVKHNRIKISTSQDNLKSLASSVKELGFEQVISQGGTDYPDNNVFRIEYHIICVSKKKLRSIMFSIMTEISKDNPEIETLIDIFPSAEFHEQETYENFGITFIGHPRMERLLLPEDWDDIPPLRKDYVLPGRG
ncbi:MAG: NADH-quinone oxidoreductase subunit C [Thaumarchaeota archaeon]|nr:NADH-quinone oxidoreductase subunit C [Nitrososphaerota archaeon]|tara:strand:+ start:16 stop:495 length:480 start_codon:yes stop_codon:yes gene_type:complete